MKRFYYYFFNGILLSLALFAYLLKNLPTPLTMVSWILLMFGLSQCSLLSNFIVVGLLIATAMKKQLTYNILSPTYTRRYNLYQIMLVSLFICSVFIVLATVKQGLLDNPEIFTDNQLSWFTEQSNARTIPWFISLPLSVYHILMFCWALWLSTHVITWTKWFWNNLLEGSLWITKPNKKIIRQEKDEKSEMKPSVE